MSWVQAIWVVHGAVNVTLVILAYRDVVRLSEWSVAWDEAASRNAPSEHVAGSKGPECLTERLADSSRGPDALLAELAGELHRANTTRARVAVLNEGTSEFESRIGFGRVGSLAWRVCVASGIAWACVALVHDVLVAAGYLGLGVVGALLTWFLGRVADSRARDLRARWNSLIRRWTRSFPPSDRFDERLRSMQCGADERG